MTELKAREGDHVKIVRGKWKGATGEVVELSPEHETTRTWLVRIDWSEVLERFTVDQFELLEA